MDRKVLHKKVGIVKRVLLRTDVHYVWYLIITAVAVIGPVELAILV
ncbi:hypothetical protein ACIQ2D_18605 [Lysinibacillus sp. NPDC097287]